MKRKSYMSISEFSHMTGIKRENLRFYDKAGILCPECRGENDYRLYTRGQLSSAYLIVALRELGIGLEEIKEYADGRTPERMLALFGVQDQRIQKEINKLQRMREIMQLYVEITKEALQYEETTPRGEITIVIEQKKKEPIFLDMKNSPGLKEEDRVIAFYDFAAGKDMAFGYPLGVVISRDNFMDGKIEPVLQYYFKVKQGQNAYKPKGLYAAAYGKCASEQSVELYRSLLAFIEERKLCVRSDIYEEYLVNEISAQDEKQYWVKIEVMVEEAGLI